MVKQPTSEQSEFTMSSEDFPALPGTSTGGAAVPAPSQAVPNQEYANHNSVDKPKRGIQTSPEGMPTYLGTVIWVAWVFGCVYGTGGYGSAFY